ncbi:MAG: hydrogenase nickel incorporation protein HypA [Nitrososphaeria archaeon]|nr:hydrogenase nickel incorporation protein HypA [Nitrososphaeria archaeon]
MHEWALAEAIIYTVTEIAEREQLKEVSRVDVKVGELQQVDLETIKFALAQLKRGKLKNTEFRIETIKARLKCRICEHAWNFDKNELDQEVAEAIHFVPEVAHSFIKCPKCGAQDFEFVEGRRMYIESVSGVR